MMQVFTETDAAFLIARPEFRRFLAAAIQRAGIMGHYAPANGQTGRDLGHFEGRRSLGFELLAMADLGQPEPERTPESLATVILALREAQDAHAKERHGERRRRADRDDSGE